LAQQLIAAGEEDTLLVIFDGHVRGSIKVRPWWQRIGVHAHMLWSFDASERSSYLRDRIRVMKDKMTRPIGLEGGGFVSATRTIKDRIEKYFKLIGFVNADTKMPMVLKINRVQRAALQALRNYNMKPYSGSVTLFKVKTPFEYTDPLNGWGEFSEDGVEVNQVPCFGYELFREPHVRILVQKLSVSLDKTKRIELTS